MRIDIISMLDNSILELALVDAFCDMCFYEGEEFIQKIEQYIASIDTGKNTVEQDTEFFEISTPYINNSLEKYSSTINEGAHKPLIVPADKNTLKPNIHTGADVLTQTSKSGREEATKVLKEEEEIVLGQIIFETLKSSIEIAKTRIEKIGESLAETITTGIAKSQRELQQHLTNTKVKGGKVALAPPEKK